MDEPLYFAYGSNLSLRQMARRCPDAVPAGRAVLPAHRLEFVQPHAGWGGGVAGIVEDPGTRVEGVLYRLSEVDLRRLDGFEPVASTRYRRVRVSVVDGAGCAVECWTYVGRVFPDAPYPPSAAYVDALVEGARDHALPVEYVRALERLRPR